MVARIVAKTEQYYDSVLKNGGTQGEAQAAARKIYWTYFRVKLYRQLYQEQVDVALATDEYENCIMTLEEIQAYGPTIG